MTQQQKYREAECYAVAPIPADTVEHFKIKITSEHGATKWLSISADEFKAIEKILIGE